MASNLYAKRKTAAEKTMEFILSFFRFLLSPVLAALAAYWAVVLHSINTSVTAKTAPFSGKKVKNPSACVRQTGYVCTKTGTAAGLKRDMPGKFDCRSKNFLSCEKEIVRLKGNAEHIKNAFTYIGDWCRYKETCLNNMYVKKYDGCFGAGVFRNIASGPGFVRAGRLLFTGAVLKPTTQ